VEGNHDRVTTMFCGLLIEQMFMDTPGVTYLRSTTPWVFSEYGENTFLATHGDGIKGDKNFFQMFLTQAREQGVKLNRHLQAFTGHLHFDRQTDIGGIVVNQMPSLTPPDSYHLQNGYVGSNEEATAYLIRKSGGKFATVYSGRATVPPDLSVGV
jgi:hypothetical protein